ncbi:hypothetical protein I302_101092 [Kwoniella bestiolae CBS 10118]|uniref:RNI-like protein n=1 Tax=Kwoniella bestiolae CBS 10118 TaxID=1296100 RepID=A0AAJ8K1L9_9TREE
MHPNTVKRILKYSLPFITTLSFQGLNRLRGAALIPFLSPFDWSPHPRSDGLTVWLPNLRHLDLRGTHRLSPSHISSVIVGSPGLKSINLRAVESCTSEVIRTIARSTRVLESLDVSRCKELTLGDMIFLINAMDESQCSRLTTLKIGGLKSYGRHASEFLPLLARRLVNLEVLDAQECLHLFDEDFERFAMALKENGRKSPIRHLNLSGCSALNGQFMVHLTGMLPNLRILEFANLTHLYKEEGGSPDDDLPLMRFMRTIPSIEKIDLDLTGVNGGVTDRVIDSLSKYRSEETDEIVGKGLRELRIGSAKDVTAEGICRLIRNCEGLGVLEIDNTAADNSVLRNFLKLHPKGRISIIDCRAITSSELDKLDSSTNTRIGHEGWQFAPFTYTALELAAGQGTRGVVKSFSRLRGNICKMGIPRKKEKGKVKGRGGGVGGLWVFLLEITWIWMGGGTTLRLRGAGRGCLVM